MTCLQCPKPAKHRRLCEAHYTKLRRIHGGSLRDLADTSALDGLSAEFAARYRRPPSSNIEREQFRPFYENFILTGIVSPLHVRADALI